MQAARDLIGILVELPAGVELGHDDLGRRHALLFVDVGGNATAVVDHCHRAIGIKGHGDAIAKASQSLVDGVVHHLVDHMMQARAVVGVADIHTGALAHRIEPAQNLD